MNTDLIYPLPMVCNWPREVAREALGISEQVGALQEGMQADFAVVSLNGVHQIPVYDPASALDLSVRAPAMLS